MSQNDFTIANQGFPAFRADLNSALQALASNNSGATEPSTMFANMWWYDSANNIMYIRNEDNDAWIKFAELDQTNDKFVLSGTLQLDDGTVSAPALTFNSDTNMGIYRGGTDILKFVTAGTDAITIDASQDVTLAGSLNFAVNEKAQFGDSNDLQIYHDGGNSLIADSGGGNLILNGSASIVLRGNASGDLLARFNDGSDVELYYNNNLKLATTSTGIDVTGTVVSDGMSTNTAGASNFIAGVNAGNSIASGGNFNTVVGDEAGTAITTGGNNTLIGTFSGDAISTSSSNTAVGSYSMTSMTDGNNNVAVGTSALDVDTKGNYSVAVGRNALGSQNFTSATDTYNTAVGYSAGVAVTTGVENTIVGGLAGDALTDADRNTAIGYSALSANTKSDRNTAIGRSALENLNHTSVTIGLNTAIGHGAGSVITTGTKNTIIGSYSGNQGSLDIRTSSNNIVLSDGDGNPRLHIDSSGVVKNTDFIIPFPAGAAPNGTFTHYNNGSQQSADVSHLNMPVACALKVKAVYLYVNGVLTTGSATVQLTKNAGAVDTINVTTGVNAFNSTGLSISYVAGDRMGIKIVGTGTTAAWYNVSVLCERA